MTLPTFLSDPKPLMYLDDNYVVLDWETTNVDNGSPYSKENKIVMGSWTKVINGTRSSKSLFGGEGSYSQLLNDIDECKFIVAHNAKFELGWLFRCGYDLSSKPIYCTQLAEYCIAGNRPWRLGLGACLARRKMGGKDSVVDTMIKSGICPSEIPPEWLRKYCNQDVAKTEQLFLHQREWLNRNGMLSVLYSRCLVTPVLTDIERTGMQLDSTRTSKLLRDAEKELSTLQIALSSFSNDINFNSKQQVANLLFNILKFRVPLDHRGKPRLNKPTKDWPDGIPAVDKEALNSLKPKTNKQKEFVKLYKSLSKTTTQVQTLSKLNDCCENSDGRMYFQYNQTRTATHRFSSTGMRYKVQGQNLDRNFKPLFKPRHVGWGFEEDDAAQLEYRFAVDYANDTAGRSDILNKVDVHYLSASTIFPEYDTLEGAAKKARRTDAKAHTFKPLYYGSSGTKSQMAYYSAFKAKHVQISEMQERIIEQVVQTKQYRTFTGLVFYWPACRRDRNGYATFSSQICNYFCQNGATAEIIPLALTYMWHRLRDLSCKSFIVNTVHDSIESEVHPDEAELIPKLAAKAIEEDAIALLEKLYDYRLTVPMESDSEVASHWSNTEHWEATYL